MDSSTTPTRSAPRGTGDRPLHRRRVALSAVVAALVAVVLVPGASATAVAAPGSPAVGARVHSAVADPLDPAERWRWPVQAPIRVIAPFRAPPTPYAAGHRGIDIAAEPAATVVAPAPGVIGFAGMVAGRPVVAIDHGDGVVSAIEPVAPLVDAGRTVAAGESIGTVSTGGHCASGCVHFGVRVDGEYVSPFLFLGGLPRAVLLPLG